MPLILTQVEDLSFSAADRAYRQETGAQEYPGAWFRTAETTVSGEIAGDRGGAARRVVLRARGDGVGPCYRAVPRIEGPKIGGSVEHVLDADENVPGRRVNAATAGRGPEGADQIKPREETGRKRAGESGVKVAEHIGTGGQAGRAAAPGRVPVVELLEAPVNERYRAERVGGAEFTGNERAEGSTRRNRWKAVRDITGVSCRCYLQSCSSRPCDSSGDRHRPVSNSAKEPVDPYSADVGDQEFVIEICSIEENLLSD